MFTTVLKEVCLRPAKGTTVLHCFYPMTQGHGTEKFHIMEGRSRHKN